MRFRIGLPEGWFSITHPAFIRELRRAAQEFTSQYGRDRRVSSVTAALFFLWQQERIELRGRLRDFAMKPPILLDYPASERTRRRWRRR
jgi:hypothetical protein